jgi:homoaconitase/3-isopropylmalate dehydratase large subunit
MEESRLMPLTLKFGKSFLEDLEHKMTVVSDEPELAESYNVTDAQAEEFRQHIHTVVAKNQNKVTIPDHMIPVIRGEMENMADIIRSNYSDVGCQVFLHASTIERQLERLTHAN